MVYDWKQGQICQSFQGHNREVTKVMSILCVQTDKGVTLVGGVSDTFPPLILPPSICQVVCFPGSTWIFSASRDKTVLMWDLNQGDDPIQEFSGHELVVNGLAISPGTCINFSHASAKMLNVYARTRNSPWTGRHQCITGHTHRYLTPKANLESPVNNCTCFLD